MLILIIKFKIDNTVLLQLPNALPIKCLQKLT